MAERHDSSSATCDALALGHAENAMAKSEGIICCWVALFPRFCWKCPSHLAITYFLIFVTWHLFGLRGPFIQLNNLSFGGFTARAGRRSACARVSRVYTCNWGMHLVMCVIACESSDEITPSALRSVGSSLSGDFRTTKNVISTWTVRKWHQNIKEYDGECSMTI